MSPKQKLMVGAAVLVGGFLYVKRSQAATAGGQALGPLGSGQSMNFGGGGSSGTQGTSTLSGILKGVMDSILAPSSSFAPTTSLPGAEAPAVLSLSSAQSLSALAGAAMPAPAPYSAPMVTSSESFWAVATAPEPLPGVWGYADPVAAPAPAYGTPASAPSVSYSDASSSYEPPAPMYGSNLEKASREWITYDANTGGAGSGAGA